MDQQTYDRLNAARQAGTMSDVDRQDYDALQAAGAFQSFQSQPPPPAAAPPVAPTPQATVLPGEEVRPQVEMPQGGAPGEAYTGGTVPRGLSYEQTQRDFATGYADRIGLPQLTPRDIGALSQGGPGGELATRLLYHDPNRSVASALEGLALTPGALVGSAVEAAAGRPAGDRAEYLTNMAIPLALGFGYAPRTMATLVGWGTLLDLGRHVLR